MVQASGLTRGDRRRNERLDRRRAVVARAEAADPPMRLAPRTLPAGVRAGVRAGEREGAKADRRPRADAPPRRRKVEAQAAEALADRAKFSRSTSPNSSPTWPPRR